MQAERDKSAVETVRRERQRAGFARALAVGRYRVGMPVADVEHRRGLIDPHDAAGREPVRHRAGDAAGARRQVENPLAALERERVGQFLRQISADLRVPAVELRGVLGVVEAGFVIVPGAVGMIVTVFGLVAHFSAKSSIARHCSSFTGMIENRGRRTRSKDLRWACALTSASGTGRASGLPASIATTRSLGSLPASGKAPLDARAVPTTAFSSPV